MYSNLGLDSSFLNMYGTGNSPPSVEQEVYNNFHIRKEINKRNTTLQYHGKLGEKELDQ